jgi:hypothetical protein
LFNLSLEWIFASLAYVSHGLIIFKYMMAVRYIFTVAIMAGEFKRKATKRWGLARGRNQLQDIYHEMYSLSGL